MPKCSERRPACELSKIFTDTVGQNGNYLEPFGRTGSHRAGIRPSGHHALQLGLYGGLGLRFQNRMFTTHMSEDDVVMGDVTRLEEAIIELDKSYAPKAIFVVASSVTAVIGTDIKGVCRYMQNEVKAKLVSSNREASAVITASVWPKPISCSCAICRKRVLQQKKACTTSSAPCVALPHG